jgi:hypothetical protein
MAIPNFGDYLKNAAKSQAASGSGGPVDRNKAIMEGLKDWACLVSSQPEDREKSLAILMTVTGLSREKAESIYLKFLQVAALHISSDASPDRAVSSIQGAMRAQLSFWSDDQKAHLNRVISAVNQSAPGDSLSAAEQFAMRMIARTLTNTQNPLLRVCGGCFNMVAGSGRLAKSLLRGTLYRNRERMSFLLIEQGSSKTYY